MACPYDSCVDWEDKAVYFLHPHFQDEWPGENVRVAIGEPDKYVIVRLTGGKKEREEMYAPIWWYFDKVTYVTTLQKHWTKIWMVHAALVLIAAATDTYSHHYSLILAVLAIGNLIRLHFKAFPG